MLFKWEEEGVGRFIKGDSKVSRCRGVIVVTIVKGLRGQGGQGDGEGGLGSLISPCFRSVYSGVSHCEMSQCQIRPSLGNSLLDE